MYDYNRMSRKMAKRLNRIRIKKKYTVCILFSINFLFVVVKKVIFRSQSGNLSFFNAYEPGHEKKRILYHLRTIKVQISLRIRALSAHSDQHLCCSLLKYLYLPCAHIHSLIHNVKCSILWKLAITRSANLSLCTRISNNSKRCMDGQVITECQILSIIVINILRKSAPPGACWCAGNILSLPDPL